MTGLGTHILFFLFLSSAAVTALPATVLIGEKEEQCFYAYAERKTKFRAEVFVFHGGALDIGFSVRGPSPLDSDGNPIPGRRKWEVRHEAKVLAEGSDTDDLSEESAAVYDHEFDASLGEYEICLSNDRRFEQDAKHVMLSITEIDDAGDEITDKQSKDGAAVDSTGVEDDDKKDLRLITRQTEKLQGTLLDIEKSQQQERIRFTRRKSAAEDNHRSMVRNSVMETVVLVVVSISQIIFVRRWFQGKGTLLKQWS